MANLKITITIPSGKVGEYVDDYIYIHQNTEVDKNGDPVYTDGQWAKEHIKRFIMNQIKRGKAAKYRDAQIPSVVDDIT